MDNDMMRKLASLFEYSKSAAEAAGWVGAPGADTRYPTEESLSNLEKLADELYAMYHVLGDVLKDIP